MGWQDAPVVTTPEWQKAPKAEEAKTPARSVGVAKGIARGAMEGVADIVGPIAQAGYGFDRLLGGPKTATPMQTTQKWIDRAVAPQSDPLARASEFGTELLSGGALGGGAAGGVAEKAAPGILKAAGGLKAARDYPLLSKIVPGLHGVLNAGHDAALAMWNKAELNRALDLAKATPVPARATVQEALAHTGTELGKRFNEVYGAMKADLNAVPAVGGKAVVEAGAAVAAPGSVRSRLEAVRAIAHAGGMDRPLLKRLNNTIDKEVIDRFTPAGKASGLTVQAINEKLRLEAARYARGSPQERGYADAVKQISTELMDMLRKQNSKELADELDQVNKAYALFKISSQASAKAVATRGIYDPVERLRAIAQRDTAKGKPTFAAGKSFGQREATAAQKAYEHPLPKVPGAVTGAVAGAGAAGLRDRGEDSE